MSKNQSIVATAIVLLSCTSCTKVLYSTNQVLAAYKTKSDVIAEFGLPAQKRQEGSITEWLYDYGSVGIRGSYTTANANGSASVYGNSVYGQASGNSSNVTTSTNYQRYLKFTFDGRDRITKWEYQGVDLSVRKKAPGRTIACVLIGVAAVVILVIAASSGGGDD